MTSIKTLALVAVAASGLVATGAQAQSASSNGKASVKVVKPIALAETQSLDFGTVIVGTTGGSVTLPATTGAVASCTTVVCLTGTSKGGVFTVSGSKNEKFSVAVPSQVTMQNGTNNLAVTLVHNVAGNAAKLDGAGQYVFAVGGSFNVPASATEGLYEGTYNVTVAYN